MKNLRNALLLKQLYQLKQLGYKYTSVTPYKENEQDLRLPNTLESLKKQAMECHLCELSKSRHKVVFGEGNPQADILFIGEGPGTTEDSSGKPFVGRSGELLTKMIENVLQLNVNDVYFTHAIKCKTLNANIPSTSEFNSCKSYLFSQIEFVKPKVIVTLGEDSYYKVTDESDNFEGVRGHVIDFKKYKLIPIYHPAFLLRNPELKKITLNDLKTIKSCL